MAQLSDEQLCALCNVMYNDAVRAWLEDACGAGATPTLREAFAGAGETYYDALEWEASMGREDWYDFVRAVEAPDSALGGLRVVDVGGAGGGGSCLVDAEGTPYAVLLGSGANDHGPNLDWFGGSQTRLQAQGRAYVDYLARLTGSDVVVTGHAEGGGAALAAAVTSGGVARCVVFDVRGLAPSFTRTYAGAIASAAGRTRAYHAAGDVVAPQVSAIAGETLAIRPTRTGAGAVKDHACVSLLDGSLAFGERVGDPSQGLTFAELASWLAQAGGQSGASGVATAAVAASLSDFVAWLGDNATASEQEKLNPFINELIDAVAGGRPKALGKVVSGSPGAAGLFCSYLLMFPGMRGAATVGTVAVLAASERTGGESDRLLEQLLSALGVGKQARSSIKGAFTRHRNRLAEQGGAVTDASLLASAAVHDFGDACLADILGTIAEIEAEPFYDVSRWDVWYRIERALGRLTLERYQNDIRSYRRKVLDIAGTTATEVRQRFTRARELDANFALQMRVASDALAELATQLRQFECRL